MVPEIVQPLIRHYILEDIQTYIERQEKNTRIEEDRAEVKVFGPFFEQLNRDVVLNVQVRIDLTLTVQRDLYRWQRIADRYVQQAKVPVKIEADDPFCLQLRDIKVLYRGGTEFLEYCTIEVSYQHIGDEV